MPYSDKTKNEHEDQFSLLSHNDFNVPKKEKKKKRLNGDSGPVVNLTNIPPYEEDPRFKDFDFIAFPFVILSGSFRRKTGELKSIKIDPISLESKLCHLAGVRATSKNKELMSEFIRNESKRFKRNPKYRRIKNPMGEDRFREVLVFGFAYFKYGSLNPSGFRETLRNIIPSKSRFNDSFSFSSIARLVWNGSHDSNWYAETKKTLKRCFPNHDIKLLCDLFAATSIRASLESNVTKFFKALYQYHENKPRDVEIGSEDNRKTIKGSIFHGFLDATIVNLNKVAKGGRPGKARGSGRKIYNFSEAMLGKTKAIVIDIWIMRAFNCDALYNHKGDDVSRSPDTNTYDTIEWYLRELGNFLNREPRGVCAAVWCAIRWEEGHTSDSTRYDDFVKMRTDHGLFKDQYGPLVNENGTLKFKELDS